MSDWIRKLSWPALIASWLGALFVGLLAFLPAVVHERRTADQSRWAEDAVAAVRVEHEAAQSKAMRSMAHADTIFAVFTSPLAWPAGKPAPPIIDVALQQARSDSLDAENVGVRLQLLEQVASQPRRTPLMILFLGPAGLFAALSFAVLTFAVKKQPELR